MFGWNNSRDAAAFVVTYRKEKLDITRLALATVADQYLEHLARENDVPLPHLSQFLSVASRLLLLKSRALLPILSFTEEEER